MRSAAKSLKRSGVCALALMGWMYSPQVAVATDAASAIADKFSEAADEGQRAEEARKAKVRKEAEARAKAANERHKAAEQRAADEAEMLRAAEEEAQARLRHQQEAEKAAIEAERQAARAEAQHVAEEAEKQRAEMERKAEEVRHAEAERLSREVDEQRIAEEKRHNEEQRIAAEKAEAEHRAEAERSAREAESRRVAEEKRKTEEARVADLKRQAEQADAKRKVDEARVAEEKRRAEEARVAEDARRAAEEAHVAEQTRIKEFQGAQQRAALEAERAAEAERIAEKFRLAREARERDKEVRSSLGGPLPENRHWSSPFIDEPVAAQLTYPQRVTVLVIMQPRRHGFGGTKMTANPVLCVSDNCYISNGAGAVSTMARRAQVLGPGNTLGRNAGVCRTQTTCAFRGVTLPAPLSTIQPVDMGFLGHDRRETRTVEPDRTCDVNGGEIYCSAPVVSGGYRAWIVPESVAEAAGPQAIERALGHGLPVARSASYDGWNGTVHALPAR